MTTIQTIEELQPESYGLRLTPREDVSSIPAYIIDQNSISNRVQEALYGYIPEIIVDKGDVYNTEGQTVFSYSNPGYTYNEYLNLQEFDYTFTG